MHTEGLQHVGQDKRIALYKRTDTKSMIWHARFRIEGQTKYKRLSTKRADFDEAKRWAMNENHLQTLQVRKPRIITVRFHTEWWFSFAFWRSFLFLCFSVASYGAVIEMSMKDTPGRRLLMTPRGAADTSTLRLTLLLPLRTPNGMTTPTGKLTRRAFDNRLSRAAAPTSMRLCGDFRTIGTSIRTIPSRLCLANLINTTRGNVRCWTGISRPANLT